MNRREVKPFAVLKCAKIGGALTTVIAALFLWPVLTVFLLFPFQTADHHPPPAASVLFMFATFPLFYGISSFFMTALIRWLYNMLSPRIGAIEIELGSSGS